MNKINQILKGKSNITPINRMGMPVRSAYSKFAEGLQESPSQLGLLGDSGNIVTGLTSALKSGLGFYGAMQDAKNQQSYNDYLAQVAEQERQDKLDQQAFENDYKDRQLAQQAELAQNQLDAKAQSDLDAFERQKVLKEIDQNNALALAKEKYKSDNNAANLKHRQELREKGIDPDLYGVDAEYTALINDALKKQANQDAINAANIELGKSGKVGMDKVQKVINDPSRSLQYGDNGALTSLLGWNKFAVSRKNKQYVAPKSVADLTIEYKNKKPISVNGYTIVEE